MERTLTFKGWVPLVGVPTLFVVAFVLGYFPPIVEAPLCGVKLFIGVPCPGCGLTHAMVSLVHGHVRSSIAYNPLGIVIGLWLLYQFARAMVTLVRGASPRTLLSDGARSVVLYGFLAALFVHWIVKLIV